MTVTLAMNKTKRRHQVLLHRCLASKQVPQDVFLLLSKLSEDEVSLWFANKVRDVRSTVDTLGALVEYQAAKQATCVLKICTLRQQLGQELSLWSDTVGFDSSSHTLSSTELGLLVLKLQNRRQAAVWALRLDMALPQEALSVRSPGRVRNLVLRVSNKCL